MLEAIRSGGIVRDWGKGQVSAGPFVATGGCSPCVLPGRTACSCPQQLVTRDPLVRHRGGRVAPSSQYPIRAGDRGLSNLVPGRFSEVAAERGARVVGDDCVQAVVGDVEGDEADRFIVLARR